MKKSRTSRRSAAGDARRAGPRHRLRIIAGNWRGSRLDFPQVAAIRPTPDRVRETLFNWLGERIVGARCLDLFAGSGALGLEALSRGAGRVVFVDSDPRVARYLRHTLQRFACDRGEVVVDSAWRFLSTAATPFDIVFLDPPFGEHLAERAGCAVAEGHWIAPGGYVYIETSRDESPPQLPDGWALLRAGRAGQVGYHLARDIGTPGTVAVATGAAGGPSNP